MSDSSERLFPTEVDFIRWLAGLIEANPFFHDAVLDPIISAGGSRREQARADLMVRREDGGRSEVLIIECKNRPIYGSIVRDTIGQINRYRSQRGDNRLVLALPYRLAEQDAARIRSENIELWDLDQIARIFQKQLELNDLAPELAAALGTAKSKSPEQVLIDELAACAPGRPQWSIYQKLVGRILEHLFCPPLNVPLSESPDESGVNRRDFVLANFAERGFWSHMRTRYSADYIVVDAKNYVGKVKKRDVLQIANYLRPHGAGLFGLIFSRNGGDNSAWVTAREQWAHYQKLVLVVDDRQCEAMLNAFSSGESTSVLAKQIQDFRLAM